MVWAVGIVILAGAAIWFMVQKVRREVSNSQLKKSISDLKDINEALEENLGNLSALYPKMFRDLLATLARRELGYGTTERISVYRHDSDSRSFRLVARYSENQKFDGFSRRTSYPDNEGVIGEAWEHGLCMPEPLSKVEVIS